MDGHTLTRWEKVKLLWWRIRMGIRISKRVVWGLVYIAFMWGFLEFAAPPVVQDAMYKVAKVLSFGGQVESDPELVLEQQKKDEALAARQAVCNHIYENNGLKNYYCPLCQKKFVSGSTPRWQI